MFEETGVEEGTLGLIRKFSADEKFTQFNVIGGTALTLRIGHRKSFDIDLFSNQPFDRQLMADHLQQVYGADIFWNNNIGLYTYINDVKVDVVAYKSEWVNPPDLVDGMRLASLEDIAATKLYAIYLNGGRLKDFVDTYFLLEQFSFNQMLNAYAKKYPDESPMTAKLAFMHHEDIDYGYKIHYLKKAPTPKDLAQRFWRAMQYPDKNFARQKNLDNLKPDTPKPDDPDQSRRRRRR